MPKVINAHRLPSHGILLHYNQAVNPLIQWHLLVDLSLCLRNRLFLQLREGGGFESVADQLINNTQPLLRSLKAFLSGNGYQLLSVNLILHSGNLNFQIPYSANLIVPP